MREITARRIHEATNMTYWLGNPEWFTGNPITDRLLRFSKPAWRTIHQIMLSQLFDMSKVIAVSGETVVARNGNSHVDKFMFRRPASTTLESFFYTVDHDVETVNRYLGGVSLPTLVDIKYASVFRHSTNSITAVTQTQRRLDLSLHARLDTAEIENEANGPKKDKTLRDLEKLLEGSYRMADIEGKYADVAPASGNVRRNITDGSVTLIDVTPFYANGSRAIGDHPHDIINSIRTSLQNFEQVLGS